MATSSPVRPSPRRLGVGRYWTASFCVSFIRAALPFRLAQEVQLGAADAGRPHDVHLGDRRRVQREDALDALAERHLAHRERRARRRRGACRSRSPRRSGCAPCRPRAPSRAPARCRPTSCRGRSVSCDFSTSSIALIVSRLLFLSVNLVQQRAAPRRRAPPCRAAPAAAPASARSAVFFRHRRTSAWCPDSSTSGTFAPANSAGRV